MKKALLTLLCVSIFMFSKAQWFNIPDTAFGRYLSTTIGPPAIMGDALTGYRMDTLFTMDSFNGNGLSFVVYNNPNIHSLEGLQYLMAWEINISNIPITYIPAPLFIHLGYLNCQYTQITTIPPIPESLTNIRLPHNQITSLPKLTPNVIELNLNNNPNLACLPRLESPNILLFFDSTAVHCLPNKTRFDANVQALDSMPLCDPLSGCDFFTNINGNIHEKTAATCADDSLNNGNKLSNIKVILSKNGQAIQQVYTNYPSGVYSFDTDSNTTYTIAIDTAALPFAVACPQIGYRNVTLSNVDSFIDHQDFGLSCKNGSDIGVLSVYGWFRKASTQIVSVNAGDIIHKYYNGNCSGAASGTVSTSFSGPIQYVSPAPGALTPTSISGNTFTYNVSDFTTIPANAFDLKVTVDSNATTGSQVCFSVDVTSNAPDLNLSNNSLSTCFSVVYSFDPNEKEVSPKTISPAGDWLTYTIHFQNTGNDAAYDVVVRDTLASSLDPVSFQYLDASFRPVIQIKENQIIFSFANINLPDSASNPSGSQGWVQFKVRTKKNLPLNTAINNRAAIYFDTNPPIFTNVTSTAVVNGIDNVDLLSMKLFPNPNTGQFSIIVPEHLIGATLRINNMLGQAIAQQQLNRAQEMITLDSAASGIYFATLTKDNTKKTIRFVVNPQ